MGFHSDSMGCSVDFMGFNGKMVNDHEELVYQWDIVGIMCPPHSDGYVGLDSPL